MNAKQHAEQAEQLLLDADERAADVHHATYLVAAAQVHATLATIKSGVTGPPVSAEVTNNIIQLSGWMVRHEVRASDGETIYTVRLGDGSYAALTRRQFFVQPRAGE
jgi:hypothetical protein